ncbi:hypothetical protein [Nakamurella leprariae]|uniref:DUF202 domain-containing protein n=1 Tax=Nakamurella leprariae TaxID=2803911 RepID=A0A939C0R5_9ACTN|nr:hypothetical protein [Nakamurella leprariae]MBM9466407.1 hypothetical protein [Nakamurella leprariae]
MSARPGRRPDPRVVALADDPGLQPQRTAQAWQRTGAVAATGALAVAFVGARLDLVVLGVAGAVLAVGVAVMTVWVIPAGRGDRPARLSAAVLLAGTAALSVLLAVLGAVAGVASLTRALGR